MKESVLSKERLPHIQSREKAIIRLKPEAYNTIVDFANASGMSISEVASKMIMFASENTVIKEANYAE